MLEKSAQAGQHSYAERGIDCYETPPEAVRALMKVEMLPQLIWEPACGPGSIVRTLWENGHDVFATDLHEYDNHFNYQSGVDFFKCNPDGCQFDAIVTNPPYQLAPKFVEHALKCAPLVIMLLRLAFYEGTSRTKILEHRGLARVHVFRNRLPMMHRKGWAGPKASSAIPFAWFVWDRNHSGPTTIDRISWEKRPCH